MVSKETVWEEIWPVVEKLIEYTLAEDGPAVKQQLAPRSQADDIYDLFGVHVFDILLKIVLGRANIAVTRAIETEGGQVVHIEFVWPDPDAENNAFTAADLVAVKLSRYRKQWRVVEINPAAADMPLTEPRAQGILITSKAFSDENKVPSEPWLLPIALFSGNLQLPLREGALLDEVEELLIPGLQHRTYGLLSLLAGRQMWRDFKQKGQPRLTNLAGWAAAIEYIIGEQTARDITQGATAGFYQANLATIIARSKRVKQTLKIKGLDSRYSPLHSTQIVFKE